MRHIPVILILSYLSYTDLKKRKAPNFAVLVLFIYSLFQCKSVKESIIISSVIFAVLLLAAVVTGGIGGGDIKLMSILAFLMGKYFFVLVLPMFVLLGIAFIYAVIKGKGLKYSVPLVPYIFVSYLFYLFLEEINNMDYH